MYVPYDWKLNVNEISELKENMRFAVMYSGGKDSGLALSYSIRRGKLDSLIHCVNDNENTLFHNQSLQIIKEHSNRLKVPVYILQNKWWINWNKVVAKYMELKKRGVEVIVFGDLGSEDNIEIQYKLCVSAGLKAYFPLYNRLYDELMIELEKENIVSVITNLNDNRIEDKWLGEKFDMNAYREFKRIGIDAFGENGEYHTTIIGANFLGKPLKYTLIKNSNRTACVNIDV